MKIKITESQYNKLINEAFPPEVDSSLSIVINKSIVNIFNWCHKNAEVKQKFDENVFVKQRHPILNLALKISRKLSINKKDSLILSYNFYIRYNDNGDYEQFMGDELIYFGDFSYRGPVNVYRTVSAYALTDVWVYARDINDAHYKIDEGGFYEYDIDYGTIDIELDVYGDDWEIDRYGIEVDDPSDIDYI